MISDDSRTVLYQLSYHSIFFKSSWSFVKSRRLWDLTNIIPSTYLDSWSNESRRRNLAEKPANFAGCQLLYTTLYQASWELVTLWVCNIPVHGEECKRIYERSSIWTGTRLIWDVILFTRQYILWHCESCQHRNRLKFPSLSISGTVSVVVSFLIEYYNFVLNNHVPQKEINGRRQFSLKIFQAQSWQWYVNKTGNTQSCTLQQISVIWGRFDGQTCLKL